MCSSVVVIVIFPKSASFSLSAPPVASPASIVVFSGVLSTGLSELGFVSTPALTSVLVLVFGLGVVFPVPTVFSGTVVVLEAGGVTVFVGGVVVFPVTVLLVGVSGT